MRQRILKFLNRQFRRVPLWRFLVFYFKTKRATYILKLRSLRELDDVYYTHDRIDELLRKAEKDLGLSRHSLYQFGQWKRKPVMSICEGTWVGEYASLGSTAFPMVSGSVYKEERFSLRYQLGCRIRVEIFAKPGHLYSTYNPLKLNPSHT